MTPLDRAAASLFATACLLACAAPARAADPSAMGTLGGNVCLATNANDAGAAIGTCRDASGDLVGVYWPPNTGPVSLASLEVDGPCDAADLNDAGVVVGNCEFGALGEWFPVIWTASIPGGAPLRLKAMLNHAKAGAWRINRAGAVAGLSVAADGSTTAVLWLPGSSNPTPLPELGLLPPLTPSTTECTVIAMTDAARPAAIGVCGLRDGGSVAVRWTSGLLGYIATELPRVPGGSNCVVAAIDSSLRVAGTCETADGDAVAVRWGADAGAPTYLDDIDASGETRQQLIAVDMNEAGIVVGNYLTDDGLARAFVWAPTGVPGQEQALDLGDLGGAWTRAVDIADNGSIAGSAESALGLSQAILWTPVAGIVGLGTLGGHSSQAVTLSRNGEILVGNSQIASGHVQAFMVGGAKRRSVVAGAATRDALAKGIALRTLVKTKIEALNPESKTFVTGMIEKAKALRPKSGEKPNLDAILNAADEIRAQHQALPDDAKSSLQGNFPKLHSLF